MGKTCCVVGCLKTSDKDKDTKFFLHLSQISGTAKSKKSCCLGDEANGYPKYKGKSGRLRHTFMCILFTFKFESGSNICDVYQIKLRVPCFFQERLPRYSVIQIG